MKTFIKKDGMYYHVSGLYKIRERKGRNLEVSFTKKPGQWSSTGTKTLTEAEDWVNLKLALRGAKVSTNLSFKKFAEDFFTRTDDNSYKFRQKMFGKSISDATLRISQSKLDSMIMPYWGNYRIYDITSQEIEQWYIKLKKKNGEECSGQYKLSVLNTFSIILDEAKRQNLISLNPCDNVQLISAKAKERSIFTKDDLEKLFPRIRIELINLYKDEKETFDDALRWATFFSILADTGFRPGEAGALRKDSFIGNGVYTSNSIDPVFHTLKEGIKTTGKGQKVKVGILSNYTQSLVKDLIERTNDDYLFKFKFGYINSTMANNKLEKVMKKAEVDPTGKVVYSFRHTFNTNMLSNDDVSMKEVQLLMGHKNYRKEYDHRDADALIGKMEKVKPIIEEMRNIN